MTMDSHSFRKTTAAFVTNGLFLVCEHLGRQESKNFAKNSGGRNIHVFDTDIIISACAPWLISRLSGRSTGTLGSLLPEFSESAEFSTELKPEMEAELVRLLAEGALHKSIDPLDSDFSIGVFQLETQFRETEEIYGIVRDHAERWSGDVRTEATWTRQDDLLARLAVLISDRMHVSDDPNSNLRMVETFVRAILKQTMPVGQPDRAVREWDNFVDLNSRTGGILGIKDFAGSLAPEMLGAFEEISVGALSAPIPDPQNDLEQKIHKEISRNWLDRLGRFKESVVDADVQAIADLFVLNWRQFKLSSGNTRVVLVTGDRNLCLASYKKIVLPVSLFDQMLEELPQDPNIDRTQQLEKFLNNFAFWHIRHLWAYLEETVLVGDPTIRDGQEGEARQEAPLDASDMDWLHGLLAEWSGGTSFGRQQLVDLLQDLNKREDSGTLRREFGSAISELVRDEQKRTEILDSVKRFRNSLTNNIENLKFRELRQYSILYPKIVRRFSSLKRFEPGGTWKDIVRLTRADLERFDASTVVSLSNVGVRVLLAARRTGRRNPPPLMFDRFSAPKRIVDALSRDPRAYENEDFERDYSGIEAEAGLLTGIDETAADVLATYLRYLVLGALFASANKWGVAHSHALRAIDIVRREKRSLGARFPVNGREAYFLAAATKRLIAQQPSQLMQAERYLSTAENAFQADVASGRFTEDVLSGHDLRFSAERLALSLGQYYLPRYLRDEDPCTNEVRVVFDSAVSVLDRLRVVSGKAESVGFVELGDRIDPIVLVSIATNFLQVRTIFEYREWKGLANAERCPVNNIWVAWSLDLLEKTTRIIPSQARRAPPEGSRVIRTPLMQCYQISGELILLRDGIEVSGGTPDLEPLRRIAKSPGIAVYDKWRHENLVELCEHLQPPTV
ncbi:hypothetical protein U5903_10640, partial [Cereibacter johrii]|uniref:hypothetical protein n=1 Tax=Cereibacter johrii TaxID=445629 RepID=UPI002B262593